MHYEGQLVLHAIAPQREIVHSGRYWVHCGVKQVSAEWTRLMVRRFGFGGSRFVVIWVAHLLRLLV
jgi:hypothetical protein